MSTYNKEPVNTPQSDTSYAQAAASSTWQIFTNAEHLDAHFAFARAAYRKAFEFAGVQPGWRVLDAGCGNGVYLPWIAEAVGPTGRIDAMDLAPENVAIAGRALANLSAQGTARTGSLTQLPYPDAAFDAIWCANVVQYLTDAELDVALAEFRRVVRPGGIVAIKDLDASLFLAQPFDPFVWSHFYQKIAATNHTQTIGTYRTSNFAAFMRRAGFKDIKTQITLTEVRAPLDAVSQRYLESLNRAGGKAIEHYPLSEEDMVMLRKYCDVDAPDHIMKSPDFYRREGDYTFVCVV